MSFSETHTLTFRIGVKIMLEWKLRVLMLEKEWGLIKKIWRKCISILKQRM